MGVFTNLTDAQIDAAVAGCPAAAELRGFARAKAVLLAALSAGRQRTAPASLPMSSVLRTWTPCCSLRWWSGVNSCRWRSASSSSRRRPSTALPRSCGSRQPAAAPRHRQRCHGRVLPTSVHATREPTTIYHYDERPDVPHRARTGVGQLGPGPDRRVAELGTPGIHKCGHHETEQADPDAVFVAGYSVCKACRKHFSRPNAGRPSRTNRVSRMGRTRTTPAAGRSSGNPVQPLSRPPRSG